MLNKVKNKFGFLSIFLSSIAIIICIFSFVYGLEDGFNLSFFQKYNSFGKLLRIIGAVIGCLVFAASITSYIKKEYNRIYLSGAFLNIVAIAWEFVIIAIGIVIIIAIISNLGA